MITYVVGDLFLSPAQVLVNTINTVGVMGKGIAKDFKRIYPEMFEQYQRFCERDQFNIGQLWLYKTSHKWILNFPTKEHWRNKSKPEYIEAGLRKFADTYDIKGITSISFPMLGCGNGELDWQTQVRPMMEHYLKKLPIDIYIHLYHEKNPFAPEHRNLELIETWLRHEPQSLAFSEFWHDLTALLVNHDNFHKLTSHDIFTAYLNKNGDTLVVEISDETVLFKSEVLLDVWHYIRSAGFCMAAHIPLPEALQPYDLYLVSIFQHLPYLAPVLLSTPNSEKKVGLQLIPYTGNLRPSEKLEIINAKLA